MHLAVALGRPVVSIFGPTNPEWIGPYNREGAVIRSGRACEPCYLRNIARCPHQHACMQETSAGQVIDRMEMVLGQSLGRTATNGRPVVV